jgi:hypothetical protein
MESPRHAGGFFCYTARMDLPFRTIPAPPTETTRGAIIARIVDGIGFRYYWATEGLAGAAFAFRPAEDCMSLGELLEHIHELLSWVAVSIGATRGNAKNEPDADPITLRSRTLLTALDLREAFLRMTESTLASVAIRTSRGDSFPFWNMLNGPLADSLTHIGQVNSWRRILGTPAPAADVFRGLPRT